MRREGIGITLLFVEHLKYLANFQKLRDSVSLTFAQPREICQGLTRQLLCGIARAKLRKLLHVSC